MCPLAVAHVFSFLQALLQVLEFYAFLCLYSKSFLHFIRPEPMIYHDIDGMNYNDKRQWHIFNVQCVEECNFVG